MDVSDESCPPSPPRPSNEELKRLEEEEEERAAKKKQVIEDLNGELLAVKERILDTEKRYARDCRLPLTKQFCACC